MATSTKTRTPGLNVTNNADLAAKIARVAELKAVERAAAAAERERKAIEAELMQSLAASGETQFVKRGIVVAKLSSLRHSTIIDRETLKSAFPEAYQAVVSEKPYRFLTVI